MSLESNDQKLEMAVEKDPRIELVLSRPTLAAFMVARAIPDKLYKDPDMKELFWAYYRLTGNTMMTVADLTTIFLLMSGESASWGADLYKIYGKVKRHMKGERAKLNKFLNLTPDVDLKYAILPEILEMIPVMNWLPTHGVEGTMQYLKDRPRIKSAFLKLQKMYFKRNLPTQFQQYWSE